MEGEGNIFSREELEKRQGERFNFSVLELVGTRDSQQDCVKWIETDGKKFAVGMADGHGKDGAEVSNLVVEIANAELKKLPEDFKFTKKYLEKMLPIWSETFHKLANTDLAPAIKKALYKLIISSANVILPRAD